MTEILELLGPNDVKHYNLVVLKLQLESAWIAVDLV